MWSQSGTRFSPYEKEQELDRLPPGIYSLQYGAFGSMHLNLMQKAFVFNYKMYGNDQFPERVIKVFNSVKSNMGVMLCGLKGTGKTVQAEQICNLSKLPVILVTEDFDHGADLVKFLSRVDQECVVMIDEYEKIFGKSDTLLSMMDGVLNGTSRRLFVLTANTAFVSDALLDRPSRIHYLKRFGNLDRAVIQEVVDDMLVAKQFRDEVVAYISVLDIVTIDIIKTVVREVNMFEEPPQNFKNILNVTVHDQTRWDVTDSKGVLVVEHATCTLMDPFGRCVGYDLNFKEFGDKYQQLGDIKSINKRTSKIVTTNGTYTVKKSKGFRLTSKAVSAMSAE